MVDYTKEDKQIGVRYGRLIVLYRVENDKSNHKQYMCGCDCGNQKIIGLQRLTSGNTKSCGCLHSELLSQSNKDRTGKSFKHNNYDLSGEYGIGWTEDGDEFWFDLEDYDLIKSHLWRKDEDGYIIHSTIKTTIKMHRLVMKVTNSEQIVDHIFSKRFDNRKSQLRIVDSAQNSYNHKKSIKNTSGVTGVYWNKRQGKWRAAIKFKGREYHLGYYFNFNDAVKARKEAEQKYFGEFAYKGGE